MRNLFPKRKLTTAEIILIPEAYLYLFKFWLKVNYKTSGKWMPNATTEVSEKIGAKKMRKAKLVAKVIDGLETRSPWTNTCLIKALATRKMLQNRLLNYKMHIGVAPTSNNQLKAHAWLSVGNEIIMGGGNLDNFHEISGFQ